MQMCGQACRQACGTIWYFFGISLIFFVFFCIFEKKLENKLEVGQKVEKLNKSKKLVKKIEETNRRKLKNWSNKSSVKNIFP